MIIMFNKCLLLAMVTENDAAAAVSCQFLARTPSRPHTGVRPVLTHSGRRRAPASAKAARERRSAGPGRATPGRAEPVRHRARRLPAAPRCWERRVRIKAYKCCFSGWCSGGGPYGGGRGHPGPPARAGPGRCGAWPARRPAALPPRRAAGGGGRSSCIYGWAAPRIAAYRDPGGLGCAQQTARASQTFIRWGQKSSAPSPSFGATV